MSDSVVVLRFGSKTPIPTDRPIRTIDADLSPLRQVSGAVLNRHFAELPREVDWAIVVDSRTDIGPQASEAVRSAIDGADDSTRCIVAADSAAVPFDRWSTFPTTIAALIPFAEARAIAAIRRRQDDVFRDVGEPIRDLLIRAAAKNELVTASHCSSAESVSAEESYPALQPAEPCSETQWLAEHLKNAREDGLFTTANSHPDAVALLAGLWQINNFLDASHDHSQSVQGQGTHAAGDYWHAIMHRREPDASNSKYWFRRVGDHPLFPVLAEHTAAILANNPEAGDRLQSQLMPGGGWDPFAFVDFCEEAARSGDVQSVRIAERIQWLEMLLLLESTYRDAFV